MVVVRREVLGELVVRERVADDDAMDDTGGREFAEVPVGAALRQRCVSRQDLGQRERAVRLESTATIARRDVVYRSSVCRKRLDTRSWIWSSAMLRTSSA